MRRLTLSGTFVILLAAIYFLWQYRFERSPESGTCRLADLRAMNALPPGCEWAGSEARPVLRLRVDPGSPGVVVRLDLPEMKAVDFLHLEFQLRARNLKPGKESWDLGRGIIEWHPRDGGAEWENDPFCSAWGDESGEISEVVARPGHPPAIPALRIENLGISGELELSFFEASVVRERPIWKIGRWLLMAGWLGWAVAWTGIRGKARFTRALPAAAVWLLMGLYFVVPGPWRSYRSFGTPFQIGVEMVSHRTATPPRIAVPAPVVLPSVGRIPDTADFTLRLKHYAEKARPLLHVILLLAPTLLIACLAGRKPALSLGIILSLAIEAAQFAFGFGFDWVDICDLLSDALGILLALAVHRYLTRRGFAFAGAGKNHAAASCWSESGSR